MKNRRRKQRIPLKRFQDLPQPAIDYDLQWRDYHRESRNQFILLCEEFGFDPKTSRPEDLTPFIRAKDRFIECAARQQSDPFEKPQSTDFRWPEFLVAMEYLGIDTYYLAELRNDQCLQVVNEARRRRTLPVHP